MKSFTYSLRGLLLLTTVIALCALLWTASLAFQHDLDRSDLIAARIRQLERQLDRRDSIRQALDAAVMDECEATRAIKDRAVQHFDRLAEKYGGLTQKDRDVVSLKVVPTLHLEKGAAPVTLRVFVPKRRAVWLKFGVTDSDEFGFSRVPEEALVTQSPFTACGPFECPLESGEHLIVASHGNPVADAITVRLALSGQRLLESVYQVPGVRGAGMSYVGASQQLDIPPERGLPELIDVRMDDGQKTPAHVARIWLDDRSSGFARFPGHAPVAASGDGR